MLMGFALAGVDLSGARMWHAAGANRHGTLRHAERLRQGPASANVASPDMGVQGFCFTKGRCAEGLLHQGRVCANVGRAEIPFHQRCAEVLLHQGRVCDGDTSPGIGLQGHCCIWDGRAAMILYQRHVHCNAASPGMGWQWCHFASETGIQWYCITMDRQVGIPQLLPSQLHHPGLLPQNKDRLLLYSMAAHCLLCDNLQAGCHPGPPPCLMTLTGTYTFGWGTHWPCSS